MTKKSCRPHWWYQVQRARRAKGHEVICTRKSVVPARQAASTQKARRRLSRSCSAFIMRASALLWSSRATFLWFWGVGSPLVHMRSGGRANRDVVGVEAAVLLDLRSTRATTGCRLAAVSGLLTPKLRTMNGRCTCC